MNNVKVHKDKILGIIVSLVFIFLIFWKLDVHQLLTTLKIFNYKVLYLFVPLYVLGMYIRGVRWKYLLCGTDKLTVKEAFFSFTTGNTLNSYLPARAGDLWRAFHVGNKIDESKMKLLGSIILERIIDGISVLLILFFAILTYFKHQWVLNIAYISAALFIGAFVGFFVIVKFNKIEFIFNKISQIPFLSKYKDFFKSLSGHLIAFMEGFGALNDFKCFTMAFLCSLAAWGFEIVLTYLIITGFGQHYGISIAFFTISFIALSTVIPSSSVFIGPYQYAYILALGIYHIGKAQALAIAFIHQLTIMIIITVISVIYFMAANTSLSDIKQELEEQKDCD